MKLRSKNVAAAGAGPTNCLSCSRHIDQILARVFLFFSLLEGVFFSLELGKKSEREKKAKFFYVSEAPIVTNIA